MPTPIEGDATGLGASARPVGARADYMESEQEARVFVASQWQLIWWRFRRHKVAFSSGIIILIIYLFHSAKFLFIIMQIFTRFATEIAYR